MQPTQNVKENPVPLPSASGPQIRSRIAHVAPYRPAYKFTHNLVVKPFTVFATGHFESIQISTGQSV
jgi:hypothetical protein